MNNKYYCSKKRVQGDNGLILLKCGSEDRIVKNTLELVLKHDCILLNKSFSEALSLVESQSTTTQILFKVHRVD